MTHAHCLPTQSPLCYSEPGTSLILGASDFVKALKLECLLSLQAHSHEQKKRVCWCLADNISKQQMTTPTAPPAESKPALGSVGASRACLCPAKINAASGIMRVI
uniref:Uncharacterized protein n=1 Tax=Sphaerodactylus townsendi TaxID=933632 RepID=A0ACB8EZW3_9SAUR